MKLKIDEAWKRPLAVFAICFVLAGQIVWPQNLGSQPQTNVAVQGQTGAQPERAFLNFINWIGNVIAPVGAGGAVGGLRYHPVDRVLDQQRNRRCDVDQNGANEHDGVGRQPETWGKSVSLPANIRPGVICNPFVERKRDNVMAVPQLLNDIIQVLLGLAANPSPFRLTSDGCNARAAQLGAHLPRKSSCR